MLNVNNVKGSEMSNVIKVPQDLYDRLACHANGFDTPVDVIEKLINYYEGVEPEAEPINNSSAGKDHSKYQFNFNVYGKGRLVLAIMHEYINDNPDITIDELKVIFPDKMQGGQLVSLMKLRW